MATTKRTLPKSIRSTATNSLAEPVLGKSLLDLLPIEDLLELVELPDEKEVPCIGYDEFIPFAKDPKFLGDLLSSIKSLIDYKFKFYSGYIEELKETIKSTDAMVKVLEAKNTSPQEIERLCPGHSTSHSCLALVQDLVHILRTRKEQVNLTLLAKGIENAFLDPVLGLASLKGRKDIKDFIVRQIYAFSKNHKTLAMPYRNKALMGPPGSGKNRVVEVLAWVYYQLFITEKKSPRTATRADLIAGYTGQTAPRVRGVFFESLGGILFIDEAYELGKGKYGKEGLSELVHLLYRFKGIGICIVAGYKDLIITKLLSKNPGLPRRFPHQFTLGPYSPEELTHIFVTVLKKSLLDEDQLSEDDTSMIYSLVTMILEEDPKAFENQASDAEEVALEVSSRASLGGGWSSLDLGQKRYIIKTSLKTLVEKKKEREEY